MQFNMREHFNRDRTVQPGGKKTQKPNHKSHLLILHKLPYKSSCLSPTPNNMSEQDSSFNRPDLMPVTKQAGICLLYPTRQITNTRLELP